ncbi:MAG: hypothetical protein HY762_05390 [Planctomycetes bacterium]|nr:hypothetical protein [Planctomycetota bacterium]
MKRPFIPDGDQAKADFLDNFALKLPIYAAILGVTPAEVTSAANDAAMFNYTMDAHEAFKTHKQNISNYKNALRDGPDSAPGAFPVAPPLAPAPTLVNDGIFTRISNLAVRMKRHPAYKEAMGEDMGIVGDEQVIDIPNMKPVLNYRLDSGRPLIIWKKGPAADVLDIYVDRKDGLGFVFLATDTQPDYLDTFPVPAGVTTAVWDYKAIYRIGDNTVGQFSEPIQVTVTRKTGY